MLFILEPNAITRPLARQRVTVYDYPDGRFAIKHLGPVLAYIAERQEELDMSRSRKAPRRRGQAKSLFKVG